MYHQIRLKQNKKILKSLKKIGLALTMVFLVLNISRIGNTNAFFLEKNNLGEVNVSAGHWIPNLTMKIVPEKSGQEDGAYLEAPCIKLFSDIEDVTIYYSFEADNIIDGTVVEDYCIRPPQGKSTLTAWAVNNDNERWKSKEINQDFKVGQEIKPGDVIINEVMWMGSAGKPKDQWIELKNVSAKDIHIKNWYLTYKSDSGNELELLKIKDDRVIKSGDYYLASYYTKNNSAIDENPDNSDLKNFGYKKFQIKLYTDESKEILIDTAGDGTQEPKEGDKDNFYSMERKNTPANGADYDNWYTCEDASSTELYWDDDRFERGTPGHKNLSKNDPISSEDDSNLKETVTKIGETIVDAIVDIVTPDKAEEPAYDESQEDEKETETPVIVEEEEAPIVEEEPEEKEEEAVKETIVDVQEKKEVAPEEEITEEIASEN